MKYCGNCGGEYTDVVTECADCGGTEMLDAPELQARGLRNPGERDTRRFVSAGVAEDPLSAEQFVRVLEAENIPVFARPRRGGAVDALTSPTHAWWEILVPEEQHATAAGLLVQEKARMESGAEEAGRAAEEEAMAPVRPA